MNFGRSNRPADPRPGHPAAEPVEDMAMDLRMDLLVDGELPEEERRAFVRELDSAAGGRWRDLAIRFLQRQTEKETAQALMAGGRLIPVEVLPREGFWIRAFGWRTITATAAGLLIVASTALVVLSVYPQGHPAAPQSRQYHVMLPAEAAGDATAGAVVVPLVKGANGDEVLFPRNPEENGRMLKRTWIIDPVKGGAVTIPVDTLRTTYN